MNIEQQFNLIAAEYDCNRRKFIPCFDDFYQNTTAFLAAHIAAPKRVVDLGAGTGLLTQFWFQLFPNAEYVLLDIAEEMLQVARKRFAGIETVSYQAGNYLYKLPDMPFDAVISALSVHHLEDAQKGKVFADIYDRLPRGGIFVNYDQFCADSPKIDAWQNTYWERHLAHSGLTEQDLALWKERRKLDKECSVRRQTDMLRQCGFETECIYLQQKFAVIAAIKR